ncbi:MAG: type II secretion system major pseudopilin GspG [Cellvibrionaceae bacterium]|nr:type II secretion system major pseudopilin GspG [Cellvibrionaceae bacterium]MCV6626952.1 type II secretion system major pseudopilin GspG [Cellvibrionaceae bacterium]
MKRYPRVTQAGFTLVELLVVLVIMTLLAGLVGPAIMNQLGGAKQDTAAVQIKDLEAALDIYKLDVGRYPSNSEGLQALTSKSGSARNWNGPYLKGGEVPQDPWGRDYIYKYPGENGGVDIVSYGDDGQPGGEGEAADVRN